MTDLIERNLMPLARRMLEVFPVTVVQGARRVGKSTFAAQLAKGRDAVFYTLDDAEVREQAETDARTLVQQGGDGLLVIDEIQRSPQLLLAIKAAVDRDTRPGRFILTGSSDLLRLSQTPDSLAGRAVTLPLMGFSQGELAGIVDDFAGWIHEAGFYRSLSPMPSREDYASILLRGSYPEAVKLAPENRPAWLRSYVERLLRLDVVSLGRSLPATRLRAVLRLLAANQAGELVYARLADQLGVSAPTVRENVELLETICLATSIPAWSTNLTRRAVGRSKVIIQDSAMAAYLTGSTASKLLSVTAAPFFGELLEGFVASELLKQQAWTSRPFELFHYRDSSGLEVDLVMEFDDGSVFLIEVKASQTYRSEFFAPMKKLAQRIGPRCLGGVVFGTSNISFQHTDRFWGLPIARLWSRSVISTPLDS
ncbi:MAG: ATP-binding protein [Propionibacteriaceae bacterium]|jgi:predicted AAA+ superfamily ATPase|nr:ATP-binding protein [Propionibacteriaceae bacterium]